MCGISCTIANATGISLHKKQMLCRMLSTKNPKIPLRRKVCKKNKKKANKKASIPVFIKH
jgi:hypothetical protein